MNVNIDVSQSQKFREFLDYWNSDASFKKKDFQLNPVLQV